MAIFHHATPSQLKIRQYFRIRTEAHTPTLFISPGEATLSQPARILSECGPTQSLGFRILSESTALDPSEQPPMIFALGLRIPQLFMFLSDTLHTLSISHLHRSQRYLVLLPPPSLNTVATRTAKTPQPKSAADANISGTADVPASKVTGLCINVTAQDSQLGH